MAPTPVCQAPVELGGELLVTPQPLTQAGERLYQALLGVD